MVLCQYFLEGRCKFGPSCRYEHQLPSSHSGFLPHAKQFNDIMVEVVYSERGNQWPLSCYAPIRDLPTIPNLEDTSPEELRAAFYDAKQKGQPESYLNYASNLYKNAQDIRNFLKQPSAELGALIQSLQTSKTEATAVVDPKTTFRFNLGEENKSSIFGNSQQPATNIFGQPKEPQAFATAPPPPQQNIFSVPPSSNIFAAPQPNAQPTNIFSQAPQIQNPSFSNPQATQSIFGNQQTQQTSRPHDDASTYSMELSDEETAIYMAPLFSFGKIPQRPPTRSLC